MAFSVASLQLRGTQTHAAELQFCTFVKAIQVAYKKLPKRKTSKIYICIIAKKMIRIDINFVTLFVLLFSTLYHVCRKLTRRFVSSASRKPSVHSLRP